MKKYTVKDFFRRHSIIGFFKRHSFIKFLKRTLIGKRENWFFPLCILVISLVLSILLLIAENIPYEEYFKYFFSSLWIGHLFSNPFTIVSVVLFLVFIIFVYLSIKKKKGYTDISLISFLVIIYGFANLSGLQKHIHSYYWLCLSLQICMLGLLLLILILQLRTKDEYRASPIGRFFKKTTVRAEKYLSQHLLGKHKNWAFPLYILITSLVFSIFLLVIENASQGDYFNYLFSSFWILHINSNPFTIVNIVLLITFIVFVSIAIAKKKGFIDISLLAFLVIIFSFGSLSGLQAYIDAYYWLCLALQILLLLLLLLIIILQLRTKSRYQATFIGKFFAKVLGIKRFKDKTDGLIVTSDYRKTRFVILYKFIFFILLTFLLVALFPLIWLVFSSFKSVTEFNAPVFNFFPKNFDITKVYDVFIKVQFGRHMLNTLIVSGLSVVFSVLFNGLLAYGISILKPKFHKVAFFLIMISYMIPSILGIVPLFGQINTIKEIISNIFGNSRLFAENGYLNYIFISLVFGANAFYFIMFKNYFDSIPKSLIEAARVDGASSLQIFFKVIVPISRPIIGIVAIFTLTASWSDFLLPKLLLNDASFHTLMVSIFEYQTAIGTVPGNTMDGLLMYIVISMVPQIIIFAIFQKQIVNSNASSGIKE